MFIPSKEELEELGFEKSAYSDTFIYIMKKQTCINFFENKWYVWWIQFFPQSIEDIKTLTRLLTPHEN